MCLPTVPPGHAAENHPDKSGTELPVSKTTLPSSCLPLNGVVPHPTPHFFKHLQRKVNNPQNKTNDYNMQYQNSTLQIPAACCSSPRPRTLGPTPVWHGSLSSEGRRPCFCAGPFHSPVATLLLCEAPESHPISTAVHPTAMSPRRQHTDPLAQLWGAGGWMGVGGVSTLRGSLPGPQAGQGQAPNR